MTPLLQDAFEKAALLPTEEQDSLARFMLAELEATQRWDDLFADPASDRLLDQWANEALATHQARKRR